MLYVRRLKGHKLLVGRSIEQTIRSIPVQLHQSLENIMLYGYYTGMFMQLVRGDVEQPDAQQDRDGKRSFFGFSDSQEDVDLEQLTIACQEYVQWIKDNPLNEADLYGYGQRILNRLVDEIKLNYEDKLATDEGIRIVRDNGEEEDDSSSIDDDIGGLFNELLGWLKHVGYVLLQWNLYPPSDPPYGSTRDLTKEEIEEEQKKLFQQYIAVFDCFDKLQNSWETLKERPRGKKRSSVIEVPFGGFKRTYMLITDNYNTVCQEGLLDDEIHDMYLRFHSGQDPMKMSDFWERLRTKAGKITPKPPFNPNPKYPDDPNPPYPDWPDATIADYTYWHEAHAHKHPPKWNEELCDYIFGCY